MKKLLNKYNISVMSAVVAILIVTLIVNASLSGRPSYDFTQAKNMDLVQGVSLTGTVKPAKDVSLAFLAAGNIAQVNVKVGDKVKQGQALLQLDVKNARAALSQAQAAVEAAQANFEKLQNGATNADIDVAKTTLNNAQQNLAATKAQQDVLVGNAYNALLNSSLSAAAGAGNTGSTNPIITGSYTGTQQGQYQISVYSTGNGSMFQTAGLESSGGQVSVAPQPLGTLGLYIQFPSANIATNNTWTISIPNTQASNYVTNNNAYQAALQARQTAVQSAQAQVDSAQAALALKQTPARSEDIAAAKAQTDAAGAQLQNAQNTYSNTIIAAPFDGIVTSVDAKIGESAAVGKAVISMITLQKFEIETYLSEADLGKVKVNDPAQVTLDAYGTGTIFDATVLSIDPTATVTNGIQTYKTTLEFTQEDERIKAGLSANVLIADQKLNNVLAIPSADLFGQDGNNFVLVDAGNGKLKTQAVQIGISDLNGYIQITSGLSGNERIVDLSK